MADLKATGGLPPLQEGDSRLNLGDFEDRFSIDKDGKLKFNNALVETAVGLKARDFKLAVTVAVIAGINALIAGANMIASWKNALKPTSPPAQLTCPTPIISVQPPRAAKLAAPLERR